MDIGLAYFDAFMVMEPICLADVSLPDLSVPGVNVLGQMAVNGFEVTEIEITLRYTFPHALQVECVFSLFQFSLVTDIKIVPQNVTDRISVKPTVARVVIHSAASGSSPGCANFQRK